MPYFLRQMDKLAHAGLYAILGGTLGYGRHHARPAPGHWLPIGLGFFYGATDEWHQGFVRGRSPDVADWVADATGVIVGYAAVLFLLGWLARRKQRAAEGVDGGE